jgi:uncharacterized protein
MRLSACVAVVILLPLMPSAARAAGDAPLVEAVRHRNRAAVRELLRQGVDVNARQADGATALHWAAQWDDLETAGQLVRAGAQPDVVNEYGVMPLHHAALNGSAAMVEILLKAGANASAALPSGETVLMTAARSGSMAAVRTLLARGADVNARERQRGQTALMWAVSERHADVARVLVEAGADIHAKTEGGFTPLLFAAREGDVDTARLLVGRGADVNQVAADGASVLLVATVRGHAELAIFLLQQGADPNASGTGYTPLHWAAGAWESLMTHDYSIESGEWSRLGGVVEGRTELIKALLHRGADPNAPLTRNPPRFGHSFFGILGGGGLSGGTPFFVAAMAGDAEMMQLLLAGGADPGRPTRDGTTPLMVAAGMATVEEETRIPQVRRIDALRLLLALGADINAANGAGNTALHATAYLGFDEVAQFLVDSGARLNPKNKRGQTPLKVASGVQQTLQLYKHPSTEALLRKLGATMD